MAFGRENSFPEMAFRSEWDQGCQDWPLSFHKNGREANPSFHVQKGRKDFRIQGKLKVERMLGEGADSFQQSLSLITENFKEYPQWVMPGVNVHPEGRSYFVELSDLTTQVLTKQSFNLTGPFLFKLLWIRKDGRTTIQSRLFEEKVPDCPAFSEWKSQSQKLLRFRMIPRPDLLDWMIGEVWVLSGTTHSEVRARSVIRPARRVFELMPETLMQREIQYRGERVLENLLEFRKNRALKK